MAAPLPSQHSDDLPHDGEGWLPWRPAHDCWRRSHGRWKAAWLWCWSPYIRASLCSGISGRITSCNISLCWAPPGPGPSQINSDRWQQREQEENQKYWSKIILQIFTTKRTRTQCVMTEACQMYRAIYNTSTYIIRAWQAWASQHFIYPDKPILMLYL